MKKKAKKTVTVGFVALGCPKNIVDSEKMLATIATSEVGLVITSDPDNADVVVINTCGFIAPAKAEAIEAIRAAVKRKKRGTVKKVIVAGCLSQRLGKSLFDEVPGIDAIVGLGGRDDIAKVIKETLDSDITQLYLPEHTQVGDDRGRLLITPAHWAYLRISEGCNRKCAFCTIPAIRGKFRSKPFGNIIEEANELALNGAVELSIIAQDSNFYGHDLKMKNGLSLLIKELEKIEVEAHGRASLQWIRLMYLYPAGIDERLIETMAQSKKVVHYVDMPMQHVNNTILKNMRRVDTKEYTQQLIERLRSAMPDAVLRTTIIVGFPGETDEQFEELLEFVKWAKFDALGCFSFYAEKDTAAAALPDQVPEEIKEQRADRLMRTQQKIAFAANQKRIGTTLTCLVDSVDEHKTGEGRFYGQ
ncbi:MAG: 30S ribosomal protein S12 methylthiotransferase RimO, partial [Sedimentisphaerales bacterium]|nr:30S ribosomal protein S12 methylthiotransferase RimO [Sedimentisphaerales bacterium]